MNIPVVDLSDFLSGDESRKQAFVSALGKAYEEVGFVAVKNHGIPDDLIADLYHYVQQFFALPTEIKLKYEKPELAGQRGYTSFGREHAKGFDAPDLKEFFQFGQTVEDSDPIKEEYPDNVVVEEVPQFTPTLFEAYRNFEKSGKALLRAIALYLGLGENCQNFDVANACLAFLNGMDIASRMIERGEIDYALVVDGETANLVYEKTLELGFNAVQLPEAVGGFGAARSPVLACLDSIARVLKFGRQSSMTGKPLELSWDYLATP